MLFFFFNDTATTEIYTLSLHDALPIWNRCGIQNLQPGRQPFEALLGRFSSLRTAIRQRSEEHTSELQSRLHLVCRLLLEKKNTRLTYYEKYTTMSCFSSSAV